MDCVLTAIPLLIPGPSGGRTFMTQDLTGCKPEDIKAPLATRSPENRYRSVTIGGAAIWADNRIVF